MIKGLGHVLAAKWGPQLCGCKMLVRTLYMLDGFIVRWNGWVGMEQFWVDRRLTPSHNQWSKFVGFERCVLIALDAM